MHLPGQSGIRRVVQPELPVVDHARHHDHPAAVRALYDAVQPALRVAIAGPDQAIDHLIVGQARQCSGQHMAAQKAGGAGQQDARAIERLRDGDRGLGQQLMQPRQRQVQRPVEINAALIARLQRQDQIDAHQRIAAQIVERQGRVDLVDAAAHQPRDMTQHRQRIRIRLGNRSRDRRQGLVIAFARHLMDRDLVQMHQI